MKALGLIFCLWVLSGCHERNSVYNRVDLPQRFREVQVGQSVETLYSILGEPLFIIINRDPNGSGAYRQEVLTNKSITYVKSVAANTNHLIFLNYSQPKRAGDSFVLYQVAVMDGKVAKKPQASFQD